MTKKLEPYQMKAVTFYRRLLRQLAGLEDPDECAESSGAGYAVTEKRRRLKMLSALFGYNVEEGSTVDNVIGGIEVEMLDQGMRYAMWRITGMHDVSPDSMNKKELAKVRKATLVAVKTLRKAQAETRKHAKKEGIPLVKNGWYNI